MKSTNSKQESFQKVITDNINNIIVINNKYKESGYQLYLNGNFLEVIYKEKTYKIKITSYNNNYYWHLTPYKDSYYETKVDKTINSLEMVLFAINEDITEKEQTKNDGI